MQDRGRLFDSLTYEAFGDGSVIFGSNMVYVRIHQQGGSAGRGRKSLIPAPPYMGVPQDFDRRILPAIPRKWEYDEFEGLILINAEEHSDHTGNAAKLYLSVVEVQFSVPVALDEEIVPTIKIVESEEPEME